MRVLFITTWNTACGIATYSANLVEALEKSGDKTAEVEIFSDMQSYGNLVKLARDTQADVIHLQHEFGICVPTEPLLSLISKFRMAGTPVVVTCHSEADEFNILLDGVADAVILHIDKRGISERSTFSNFVKIPHGIPEITFPEPKSFYRKKYGIPEDAFVVGTCGFLTHERAQSIENLMVSIIEKLGADDNIYFNISTSSHRSDPDGSYANTVRSAIHALANGKGFGDRVYVGTKFTPVDEFRERLYCCDLGFHIMPKTASSNSGAAADLISCRIPLVVNDTPHFSHLAPYSTVILEDPCSDAMADKILEIVRDPKQYKGLVAQADTAIDDLGYSKIAEKHHELYQTVVANFNAMGERAEIKSTPHVRELNKSQPVSIKLPNSMWQTLFLWGRVQALVEQGHQIHLIYQHDGLMETSMLEFALEGIHTIDFGDVGMGNEARTVRLHSRSLAQNMTTDVENWVRGGHDIEDLFDFCGDFNSYQLMLGSYAMKKGEQLTSETDLVIDATTPPDFNLDEIPERVMVIDSPTMDSQLAKDLIEYLGQIADRAISVKYVTEDTRTRWATMITAKKVYTGFGDTSMVCSILGATHMSYLGFNEWQQKIINFISSKVTHTAEKKG